MKDNKMKYVDKYKIICGLELNTLLEIIDMQDWKIDATGESIVLMDDNSKIVITNDESGEGSIVYVYTEKYSVRTYLKFLLVGQSDGELVEYKIG